MKRCVLRHSAPRCVQHSRRRPVCARGRCNSHGVAACGRYCKAGVPVAPASRRRGGAADQTKGVATAGVAAAPQIDGRGRSADRLVARMGSRRVASLGISARQPRRRRDSSPRNIHLAAAASPRLCSVRLRPLEEESKEAGSTARSRGGSFTGGNLGMGWSCAQTSGPSATTGGSNKTRSSATASAASSRPHQPPSMKPRCGTHARPDPSWSGRRGVLAAWRACDAGIFHGRVAAPLFRGRVAAPSRGATWIFRGGSYLAGLGRVDAAAATWIVRGARGRDPMPRPRRGSSAGHVGATRSRPYTSTVSAHYFAALACAGAVLLKYQRARFPLGRARPRWTRGTAAAGSTPRRRATAASSAGAGRGRRRVG